MIHPALGGEVDLVQHEHAAVAEHSTRVLQVAEHVLRLQMQLHVVAEDEVDRRIGDAFEVDPVEHDVIDFAVQLSCLQVRAGVLDHLGRDVPAQQGPASRRQALAELAAPTAELEHVRLGTEIGRDQLDDQIGELRAAPLLAQRARTPAQRAVALPFLGVVGPGFA